MFCEIFCVPKPIPIPAPPTNAPKDVAGTPKVDIKTIIVMRIINRVNILSRNVIIVIFSLKSSPGSRFLIQFEFLSNERPRLIIPQQMPISIKDSAISPSGRRSVFKLLKSFGVTLDLANISIFSINKPLTSAAPKLKSTGFLIGVINILLNLLKNFAQILETIQKVRSSTLDNRKPCVV